MSTKESIENQSKIKKKFRKDMTKEQCLAYLERQAKIPYKYSPDDKE